MVISRLLIGLSIPMFPFDLAAYGLFMRYFLTFWSLLLPPLLTCQLARLHYLFLTAAFVHSHLAPRRAHHRQGDAPGAAIFLVRRTFAS